MKLKKYIEKYIDDPYAMSVLYYYTRRFVMHSQFDSSNVDAFNISGKFLGKDIELDIPVGYKSLYQMLGLVLSVRALMIKPEWLKKCYDGTLLFPAISNYSLSWTSHQVILDCYEDEDFRFVYDILLAAVNEGHVSEQSREEFKDRTKKPEYRNISQYYNDIKDDDIENRSRVIKSCEYLCNDEITEFTVNESVEYVGDTAFAYCPNLTTLIFDRKKTLFGRFSIIECPALKIIIVPQESEDLYKKSLPYYEDIITSINDSNSELIDNLQNTELIVSNEDNSNSQVEDIDSVEPKKFNSAFKKVIKEFEQESLHASIKIKFQSWGKFVQFYSSKGQRSFNIKVFGRAFADYCKDKSLKSIEEYYEGIREFGEAEKSYYNEKFLSIIKKLYNQFKKNR